MTVTAATATPATATSATSTTSNDLSSLSGNFNDFLNLLMTQLQNQDPTSPMDTNQFTSQLVQYSSVEQQINTNSNLQTLIQATQSNTILQSSSMIGKQVDVTSDHLALQSGASSVHFDASKAENVNISVYSASGDKVYTASMSAASGNNDWSWNGQDSQGNQLPDGSYQVSVVDQSGNPITTTVTGTVTGLQRSSTGVSVSLGALSTDIANVQSVVTANSTPSQ